MLLITHFVYVTNKESIFSEMKINFRFYSEWTLLVWCSVLICETLIVLDKYLGKMNIFTKTWRLYTDKINWNEFKYIIDQYTTRDTNVEINIKNLL